VSTVIRKLQIVSRGFHCKTAKDLNCSHGKFENEIRRRSIGGLNLCLGGSGLCQTVSTAAYILTYDVTLPIMSLRYLFIDRSSCTRDEHGMSHPLSGAVAYSTRVDRTTATLRLLVFYGYSLCLLNNIYASNFTAGVHDFEPNRQLVSVCWL